MVTKFASLHKVLKTLFILSFIMGANGLHGNNPNTEVNIWISFLARVLLSIFIGVCLVNIWDTAVKIFYVGISFSYVKEVDNQPLNNPLPARLAENGILEFENGQSYSIAGQGGEVLTRTPLRKELEEVELVFEENGVVHAFVKMPVRSAFFIMPGTQWRCGNEIDPVTIPIFVDREEPRFARWKLGELVPIEVDR